MADQWDVAVVGAGPVGLSLALGLGRNGIDTVVFEKTAGPTEHSRAPAIWPKTQEVLADLGIIDRFLEEGLRLPYINLWDVDRERVLLQLPVEELRGETPYPHLLILPQSSTERLLKDAVQETAGVELRYSSDVRALSQRESEVKVRYRTRGEEASVRTQFVAGCDGAHSNVRDELGASFDGVTYDVRVGLADIVPAESEDLRFPRVTTDPFFGVGIRMAASLWRVIVPLNGDGGQRLLDTLIHEMVKSLFSAPADEIVWKSEFRIHRRVSSRWLDERVVLAGDAAHLNSPVGGQGMNAGILDAAALTDALVDRCTSADGASLAAYVEKRRGAIESRVNPFTDRLTRLLFIGDGRYVRPIIGAANLLLKIGPVRQRTMRRMAMLDQL
jgi:2-polyprenyl-6-methoxyphenol hydroxylase-like FAD-dependent oxidoreductase